MNTDNLDKNEVIRSTVKTSLDLQKNDLALIKEHKVYILRLARSNNNAVDISIYLQNHGIDIRISSIRSFLSQAQ